MKKLILALYLLFGASQLIQAQSITLQPNTGNNGNLLIKSTQYVYGNLSTTSASGADLFFRLSEPTNGIGIAGTQIGAISTFPSMFQLSTYNSSVLNFNVNNKNTFRILSNGYTGINQVAPIRFFHVNGSTILTEMPDTANVQIGTTSSNLAKLVVSSTGFPNGVLIDAFNTGGGYALNVNGSTNLNGELKVTNSLTVQSSTTIIGGLTVGNSATITGSLNVSGNLSKGSGTFKIDHPIDPENKYLYHSFVESPDMMNIYNGNITTDKKGYAHITMPSYFEALNMDFRYQLTTIRSFSQAIVWEKIKNNEFIIRTSKPNTEVSWQVTGVRKDAYANKNRVKVEVEKPAEEKGFYLYPEAFDLPASRNVQNAKKNTIN